VPLNVIGSYFEPSLPDKSDLSEAPIVVSLRLSTPSLRHIGGIDIVSWLLARTNRHQMSPTKFRLVLSGNVQAALAGCEAPQAAIMCYSGHPIDLHHWPAQLQRCRKPILLHNRSCRNCHFCCVLLLC